MLTPVEINTRNRAFWMEQSRIEYPLLTQPIVVRGVIEWIASEQRRGLSVEKQLGFHEALSRLGEYRRQVLSDVARTGRRARKPDALQSLILEIVTRSPSITRDELLERLRDMKPGPVIEDIEQGKIYFIGPGGQSRSAPFSGLKDRLSRAKKTSRIRAKR